MQSKVRGYIFREKNTEKNRETQVLVFDQPDYPSAGVQVPGGTIDEGESLTEALVREIWEESGLTLKIGWQPAGSEVIAHPETGILQKEHWFVNWSCENIDESWIHKVTGNGEDNGIHFRYYWLGVELAKKRLWNWMSLQMQVGLEVKNE